MRLPCNFSRELVNKYCVTHAVWIVLTSIGFPIPGSADKQQVTKAEKMYQEGLLLMEARGDYARAIEIFNEIIKNFPRNRPISARAQYWIGVCYERMGEEKAREAYEKVIKNYPEETDVVAQARRKISSLMKTGARMSVKLIHSGPAIDRFVSLSPDGNRIAYTDWGTGNLAVKNLSTNTFRLLTNTDLWQSPEFALFSTWSPDGKHIAYSWYRKEGFYDLRIGPSNGGESRVIFSDSSMDIYPKDWSRDGKYILCAAERKDRTFGIGIVSPDSAQYRELGHYRPTNPKFSPDGNFVVLDMTRDGNTDLYVHSIEGGSITRLTDSPADDDNPLWSPDGKYVLFRSNRRGTRDLWGVEVKMDKPAGSPFLVKSNVGEAYLSTWTSNGKLLYGITNSMQDVYAVSVDPGSGEVKGQAYQIVPFFSGKNLIPMWSHDGKWLTYVSTRHEEGHGRKTACILDLESGKETELRPGLWINSVRLSPDGRYVALTGLRQGMRVGCYLMSVQTGEGKVLIEEGNLGDWLGSSDEIMVWTDERGSVLKEPGIFSLNAMSGALKKIISLPPELEPIRYLEVSPEGKSVCALVSIDTGRTLWVLPLDGSKPREIFRAVLPSLIAAPTWSPDGSKIAYLYNANVHSKSEGYNMYVIPASGGTPRKLEITVPGKLMIFPPAWSPDGRTIAFTVDRSVGEVWVMENFMPKNNSRKN